MAAGKINKQDELASLKGIFVIKSKFLPWVAKECIN